MRNRFYKNKGFTLIELLVVVAVIGVLASVVLAALTSSRDKATDAKIKSQLRSMITQAELYSGTGTAFTTATPCATTAGTVFETGNSGLGNLFVGITMSVTRCGSGAGKPSNGVPWAVATQTSTGAWCVDSLGTSRDKTSAGTAYTTTLTTAIAAAGTACL